jgi:acyl-CoA oxidase
MTPIHLHRAIFLNSLRQQLSDKQKAKWLPLAQNLTVIGTYAQTELGHGSFIRGLETTAVFDEQTDELVLNTPTLTSIKWWPGNMAKTCNHCVVMGQLIVKGKSYGLQGFIVPIRDIKTHEVLPGVELGDIGPKFGFDMIDNGYLKMANVRIPRENMLMRYVNLSRTGEFTASKHAKILYATMVLTRVSIVYASSRFLARAAVVATRYSAVRLQFPPADNEKGPEVQVIDYQTQQQKLIPNLASAYTFHFAYGWLKEMYDRNTAAIQKGDFSLMGELHAVSSCLKALASEMCIEGMEICRKSCGGHGFMKFTGSKCKICSS